jgi:hypothetical protein
VIHALPPFVELARVDIDRLVESAVSEGDPIDSAITAALYPDGAPQRWRDWHRDAVAIYDEAVELFGIRRREMLAALEMVDTVNRNGRRSRRQQNITPARGWAVVRESMGAAPSLRLTWPALAQRLGVRPRAAVHLFANRLGFRFGGGGKMGERVIIDAPCGQCGIVHPAGAFVDRDEGPCCIESQLA